MAGAPSREGLGGEPDSRWWTLRRRVALLVIVVALGVVVVTILSVFNVMNTRDAVAEQQGKAIPAAQNVNSLLASVIAQENGERGYIITGDTSSLTPYTSGRATTADLLNRLRSELGGNAQLIAKLTAIEQADQQWINQVAEPEIADVQSGNTLVAVAEERNGTGQEKFDSIRTSIGALSTAIAANEEVSEGSVREDISSDLTFTLVRAWVVLALLAILWLLLTRLISLPIGRLTADVRRVSDGDLDRPVSTSGPPEIAQLGQGVEAMRQRLRDESDELRQLRQALAQRSPLHGLIKSELEPSGVDTERSLAGRILPADGILAGDWWDAWDIDGNAMALALVDVSGHGPEAGMLALKIKHLFAPPFQMGMQAGTAVGWVSQQLDDLDDQCATAIVVELDFLSGRCTYANAGHPPGLLFRNNVVEMLPRTGPLICGIGGTWETGTFTAEVGDLLVLVTDGLTEARLPDGTEFGFDRLVALLKDHPFDAPPREIADGALSAIREACASPLRDDATIVVLRFNAMAPPSTDPASLAASGQPE